MRIDVNFGALPSRFQQPNRFATVYFDTRLIETLEAFSGEGFRLIPPPDAAATREPEAKLWRFSQTRGCSRLSPLVARRQRVLQIGLVDWICLLYL